MSVSPESLLTKLTAFQHSRMYKVRHDTGRP